MHKKTIFLILTILYGCTTIPESVHTQDIIRSRDAVANELFTIANECWPRKPVFFLVGVYLGIEVRNRIALEGVYIEAVYKNIQNIDHGSNEIQLLVSGNENSSQVQIITSRPNTDYVDDVHRWLSGDLTCS